MEGTMDMQRISRWIGGFLGGALLALSAIALAPLAAADDQQAPPPAEQGRPGPRRGFGLGRGGPGPLIGTMEMMGMGIPGLDLSDAQREQIKAIRDRHAEEIRPLAERAQAGHKALADATLANPVDVNQLRVAANEVGAAEGELAFARAQVEAEVLTVLTPGQREQMAARRKEMEQRRSQMQQRRGRG
jgi:Spy/CpxP family protein refolding chaperone